MVQYEYRSAPILVLAFRLSSPSFRFSYIQPLTLQAALKTIQSAKMLSNESKIWEERFAVEPEMHISSQFFWKNLIACCRCFGDFKSTWMPSRNIWNWTTSYHQVSFRFTLTKFSTMLQASRSIGRIFFQLDSTANIHEGILEFASLCKKIYISRYTWFTCLYVVHAPTRWDYAICLRGCLL